MPSKLARPRLLREPGFVYFVDPDGDVSRLPAPGRRAASRARKVVRLGLALEPGYLYFVDRDGDVARARTARAEAAEVGD